MSISKRMYGVEGYLMTSTSLSLYKIKSFAPNKIGDYFLIDSFKKNINIFFIYETKDGQKRKTIFINLNEIEESNHPHNFVADTIKENFPNV